MIAGTPAAATASAGYLVTATNATGSSSVSVTLEILDPPPTLNYLATPFSFHRNVEVTAQAPVNTGGAIVSCGANPALPAGLSLSSACVLSGTPSALAAAASYTITATNAGGTASQVVSIEVVNQPVPVLAYAGSPYVFTQGNAVTPQTPSNTGGPITGCSVSPALPAGLSLSSGCVLSGTPSVVSGTASYTVTASNAGGSGTATVSITVNAVAPVIAYAGSPFVFTQGTAIAAQTPTNGGGAITGCSASPALPSGLSLSSVCVLSGTPSAVVAAASYTITATNSGGSDAEVVSIAVSAAPPTLSYTGAPYTFPQNTAITPRTPTNTGGTITSCSSSPALPTGLSLSTTCVLSGTPTVAVAAASYVITGTNTGGSASATISITVNPPAPVIAFPGGPFTRARGLAAAAISATNTGGAIVTCGVSPALPAGLALSSTTCQITGTPTVLAGAANYTVTATNAGGSGSATVNLRVNDQLPAISFSPATRVLVLRDLAPSMTVTNTGGFISSCVVAPTLPAGLSISSTTCAISGTPTATSAATNYTVSATNGAGTATAVINLRVRNQVQIVFDSLTAVAGGWNGTIPSSRNVWRISRDGVDRLAITANTNANLPSLGAVFRSTTGMIAYASRRAANGATNGTALASHNIWTSLLDATGPSNLTGITGTGQVSDTAPVFSPDGTKIAFSSSLDVSGVPSLSKNIFIMNANGTGLTALTVCTAAGRDSIDPTFSPDGQRIYFVSRINADGTCASANTTVNQVWRVNAAGGGLTLLTPGLTADARAPMVYPLSTSVADEWAIFVSQTQVAGVTSSSRNVFKINANATGLGALTANTVASRDSFDARFAPDGSEIVFASRMNIYGATALSSNIWKMALDGSGQVPLTTETVTARDSDQPNFDPTSSLIVFRSRMQVSGVTANSTNVWLMNDNGTGATPLTRNTNTGLGSDLNTQGVFYQEP